ncbi:MAG TPA: helix-turn-helix transcriptional regulator [Herpetosiphonaceae bacterium]|nr:helix-turn-helix transcriptional regulator [Herpetosiphonaceae bacterium]
MTSTPQLSRREQDVVDELLQGKSNKLIALALDISDRTVEFHLHNIYLKHSVQSRIELILKLGKPPGAPETADPGLSTVVPDLSVGDDSAAPGRAAFFSAIVAHIRKDFTMNTQWKAPIANGILWAAAIIAAAIVGAPAILAIILLPVLAMVSFLVAPAPARG